MAANLSVGEEVPTERVPRLLDVRNLGLIPYQECLKEQSALAAAVMVGEQPDTLLLLEHRHTYTCGRAGGRDHILVGPQELHALGAIVVDVDRGGDVTYHGPGQLVAYPVINLFASKIGRDYRGYIRALEQVLIDLLADFGIASHRLQGLSGAWVQGPSGEEKIAAIGVKVDGRGVTTHGIALNVTSDLSYFSKIVPCGITDRGVTSMARLLDTLPEMAEVKLAFGHHFREVFEYR